MPRPRRTWPQALLDILAKGVSPDDAVKLVRQLHPGVYCPDASAIRRRRRQARRLAGVASGTNGPAATPTGGAPLPAGSLMDLLHTKAKLTAASLQPEASTTPRNLAHLADAARRLEPPVLPGPPGGGGPSTRFPGLTAQEDRDLAELERRRELPPDDPLHLDYVEFMRTIAPIFKAEQDRESARVRLPQ